MNITAYDPTADAIAWLKAAGYNVSKPKVRRAKIEAPKFNALGLPMSTSFDPAYKMKHTPTSISRLLKPYSDSFRDSAFRGPGYHPN